MKHRDEHAPAPGGKTHKVLWEDVMAHFPDAVIIADRAGAVKFANAAAVQLCGYTAQEIGTIENWVRQTAADPEVQRQALEFWKKDTEDGPPAERFFPIVARNGHAMWCRFRVHIMSNGDSVVSFQDFTQQKTIEKRYHALFDQAADSIFLVDPATGGLVDFNRKACETLGYSSDELRTMSMADVDACESVDEVKQHVQKILRAGFDIFETKHRKKNGDLLDVRVHAWTISIGGRPFVQSTIHDITDRQRISQALRDSEGRFRTIIDQSPVSMAIIGLNGTIDYINRKAVTTFGYTPEDIPTLERWWVQAYPDPTYREQVIATWTGLVERAIAENHEIEGREYRVTCKDGTVKIMLIFGVPVAGKVFVMFEDVTARKEAEETFQNLAERSPNMIFINRAGRVVYANTKCEETMGYSRQEICSPLFDFMKLVAPEYHAVTRDHFQKHMRGMDVPSIEYVIIAKSGTRIPAMISTKLIHYNGQPAILGIVTDVSQLKHAEASLRESAAILQEQKRALEAKNAALKEVLAQIEAEKLEIRRHVTANAEKLLLPILHKMKRKAGPADRRQLDVLESNVRDLTSQFGTQLSSGATALSVRETEITNMIKSGLSSKEIAQLLQVSIRTVDTYRNRIRKKLGISRKSVNLSSHLQTLS